MEKLPPELVLQVAEYLANDLPTLKSLKLSAKLFSAGTTKYLYRNLVLYNTISSSEKFNAVIKHDEYSSFVKTIESSGRHDETCIDHHYAWCGHEFCHQNPGYLNHCGDFRGSREGLTLILTGFRHMCGQKLDQVKVFGNISKLELDFSLLVGQDHEEMMFFRKPPIGARWWESLNRVKDLTVSQRPTLHGSDRFPFLVNMLWPLTHAGWSSLENLTLKHTATSKKSFERFIHQQSKTLTSLRIIEPVIAPNTWNHIKPRLQEMAPKLERVDCTDPYVPKDQEKTIQEWYDQAIFVIFPIEEARNGL